MTRQRRILAVLGVVLAVALGAHPAVVLAVAAAVIALALAELGFAIAVTGAESGWRTEPRGRVVSA
jgi:disulfide bond formation protein DsbB